MESEYASVALKSCQLVDHVEKAQSDLVLETPVVGNKDVSQSADFKSNSSFCKLGKRKRQGEVRRCSGSVTSPLKNYANFMKSGPLSRLLYHQDGEWVDFPNEVTELVRKKFQMKHAVVDVELEDFRFILDVMYMRKLDSQTGLQKPIAWIDDAGSCFFPEIYGEDDETQELRQSGSVDKSTTQDIKLHLQIEFSGVNDDKVDENVDELRAFKKTRVGESLNDYHNVNENESNDSYNDTENSDSERGNAVADNVKDGSYANLDRRIPKIAGSASTEVNFVHNDVDLNEVSSLFIAGMGNFSCASVVEVKRCFGKLMQNRLELFEKQMELTEKSRGSSNVQYAWLPCSRKDESSFMTYGLRLGGLSSIASYGHGVHLSSKKYAYASLKNCDDDENGVRRMLLCRVILGNIEPVHFGSDQFCPSSDQFDTGVDNILEPRTYVVWEVNALTHIYPEYVVSFKLPSKPEVGAFGAQVRKSEASGVITSPVCPLLQFVSSNASGLDYHPDNHFQNEHQRCTPMRTPKSPWMPFPLLFESISKKVSPKTMNMVYYHYNQFKCKNIISRGEFIKRLRLAVGDPLLKSTITSLQGKEYAYVFILTPLHDEYLRLQQPNLPSCPANLKAPKAEPDA